MKMLKKKKWAVRILTGGLMLGMLPCSIFAQAATEEPAAAVQLEAAADSSPVQIIDGKAYLFDENGILYTGSGTPVIDGSKYWANADGSLNSGWLNMGSWRMYFDPEDYTARTGISEAEGKTYLFDENGLLQTGSGTPVIGGLKYWMNGDSSLNAGWLRFNGWQMYFDPVTYAASTGLTEIDGKVYIFDANGVMQTASGTPVIDGSKYWINSDGSLSSGWLNMGSWRMYFDPEDYTAAIGLTGIDGKTYLFDQNGLLQTGSGTPVINGSKYWMNSDSSLNSGWLNMGSWRMYFNPDTYAACTGLTELDGKMYIFDSNGLMQTNAGTPVVDGAKYWINTDGSLSSGWLNLGGMRMYFRPDTFQSVENSFYEIDGNTYYFDQNGVMVTGTREIDGYLCTFDQNGVLLERTPVSRAEIYARQTLNSIGWNLRAAFNWSASLRYYNNGNSETGAPAGYTFAEYEAIYGFENGRGDCETMAATFYYMARALGYDVHMVRGYVPLAAGGMGHHAWCEIVMNGTVYVFDPQFTNQTGRNGYQITYGTSGTWRYSDYARIN